MKSVSILPGLFNASWVLQQQTIQLQAGASLLSIACWSPFEQPNSAIKIKRRDVKNFIFDSYSELLSKHCLGGRWFTSADS
jgi:hypothetical protein